MEDQSSWARDCLESSAFVLRMGFDSSVFHQSKSHMCDKYVCGKHDYQFIKVVSLCISNLTALGVFRDVVDVV